MPVLQLVTFVKVIKYRMMISIITNNDTDHKEMTCGQQSDESTPIVVSEVFLIYVLQHKKKSFSA